MANLPCNHLPVTPPADHDKFTKGLFSSPNHPVAQPVYGAISTQAQPPPSPPQSKPQSQAPSPLTQPQTGARSPPGPQPQARVQPPFPPFTGPTPHLYDRAGNAIDPRYVVMASRISAYYQQRCQAIAAYQQQRCQQWANLQRQKCQEMMQAAMLVVAWYIRDRISRRRRRAKHHFRRGLSRRTVGGRPTKGEVVRRWVLAVPDDVLSAGDGGRDRMGDPEEGMFSLDKQGEEPDKDTKMFKIADDMIRSQVGKIEMPLLGVLDFDESESESESEAESESEEEEYEQAEDEEMEYDEEEGEEEEVDQQKGGVSRGQERMGSQEVQVSSGRNSRKKEKSSCGS